MKALILVDIQNDFLPGGALAVPRGDEVIAVATALIEVHRREGALIVATQDWHPADHGSFASQHPGKTPGELFELDGLPQVMWPDHCVQETHGAAFASGLALGDAAVFQKGSDRSVDSYSGFFDNGKRTDTGLDAWLKERSVDALTICGLATDYCVKFTAMDARALGYPVTLVVDGCRAVELEAGDSERALTEMKSAGVTLA